MVTKGRWKKLCRPPTHGVSQYRFTAARVQWPCSTVTIKPIWSLKWSGQVCDESYGPGQFERISSGMELWADNYDIFRMCQLEHWTSTTRLVQPPKAGGTVRIQALPQKTRLSRSCQFTFFCFVIVGGCRERPGLEDYWHSGLYQSTSG